MDGPKDFKFGAIVEKIQQKYWNVSIFFIYLTYEGPKLCLKYYFVQNPLFCAFVLRPPFKM